ncbi:sulfite exporter TauE/SafE family protein [Deinococcus kurensis]|uniref:sulfite exporter TauE/SafE family protein n=1 Tax=Deinococcus kurensis TaxID=2662757 RepID=UPI0012D2E297|nr:sulfite exporter TauE/SafE family protein [Deinococcus kurensis]
MILAWIGAALIGLSLGLLGSGGSILTVPVLVYLGGEPGKLAITESLAIVGLISLFGALPYARGRQIDWARVVLFGLPGMVGTAAGSALSVHLSGGTQLLIFAAVMLVAATLMVRPPPAPGASSHPAWLTALEGAGVGVLTGVVGVGGGFLIVPALVLLGGLPMSLAVGTSLSIITLNSAAGLLRHLDQGSVALHWPLIGLFAVIGVAGSQLGARIGRCLPQVALRRGFAAFLVVMGLYVLTTNVPTAQRPLPTVDSRAR